MMYLKKLICKKSLILTLFSILLLLSGCGKEQKFAAVNSERCVEESGTTNEKIEDKKESDEANEMPEEVSEVVVNTQALDVSFYCEDGIDPLRAIHRCVADGGNIYLAYTESDLYMMPLGGEKHLPVGIDNPNKMKVCHVTIDFYGRIHLLMANQDYDEWYIWRLDENNQVDSIIDISTYCETIYIPNWFFIDKEGFYYLQWPMDRSGIILDSNGIMLHKTTPETLGLSWIYEASLGKDGSVYIVYSNGENRLEIGELDMKNGTVKNMDSSLTFPSDEVFTVMAAGTDTNLLLFSPYSGVWAYDKEKGILEKRVAISDIGYESHMEYWALTFLPDGRLLALGQTFNDASAKDEEVLMKYIPAGR